MTVLQRLALIAGLTIAAWVTAAVPALAHVELDRSEPPRGETLDTAPAEVFLRFTGEIEEGSVAIRVRGPEGDDVTAGDTESGGRAAAVGLGELTENGVYRVRYTGTSADGHPFEGRLRFRLRLAGDATPAPTSVPTDEPAGTAAPTTVPTPGSTVPATQRGTVPWWPFAVLLGVAAAVGITMFRRR